MYRVLKPRYEKTGEVTYTSDGDRLTWFRVEWQDIGPADNYEDARKRYGGRPVLEYCGKPH